MALAVLLELSAPARSSMVETTSSMFIVSDSGIYTLMPSTVTVLKAVLTKVNPPLKPDWVAFFVVNERALLPHHVDTR